MILILGGGLAGLSTAYHLGSLPHLVLEAEAEPGGLCRSREVAGFVFDYTGHLLHLRDERALRLVDELLPGGLERIERRAYIRTRGVSLPFPFQAHLHGLPSDVIVDCIAGFVERLGTPVPDSPAASFEEWCLAVLGPGIAREFMFPYNEKLFRRPAAEMTADWVSWAIPRPSLREVVRGALGIENSGLGYNPSFRYPREGGIGALPRALAARVPALRTRARVEDVDLERRVVRLADGTRLGYDRLVVTIPLPRFLRRARGGGIDGPGLASRLDWSVVGCVNLGIARAAIADGAHWIYTPDADVPFYRVGFPSNFSSHVAPAGSSSIYVEFGLRRDEAVEPDALVRQAEAGLRALGILEPDDEVLVRDFVRLDPGYVIFDRARQAVLARAVPELEALGVHLIGRYGAWTYSYMERALLDGLELAEALTAAEAREAPVTVRG